MTPTVVALVLLALGVTAASLAARRVGRAQPPAAAEHAARHARQMLDTDTATLRAAVDERASR